MKTTPGVLFLFPPFAYSAVNGPYLAPALLTGILERVGIKARSSDLNIRAIRAVLTGEWLMAFRESLYDWCEGSGVASEHALLDALISDRGVERLARYRYGLRYSLHLIQKALFPQPHAFEDSLNLRGYGGAARERLYPELLDTADVWRSETVCFSVAFGEQLPECLYLARLIRQSSPGKKVLLGGAQINLFTADQLERILELDLFDSIFVGNGEHEITRFLNGTTAGKGGVYRAEPIGAETLIDLPSPLFPDWEMDLYFKPWTLPVLATKGCYWARCTFCDYAKMNAYCRRKYLTRPPEAVLNELSELDDHYAPSVFLLISDGISPSWYRRLATLSVDSGRSLKTWSYMLHADKLDKTFFNLLKRAGVHSINFGSETTNDRVLSMMNKLGSRDTILRNILQAHEAGLNVVMNIIMDFPTLSFEEAIAVADDLIDLGPAISILNPQVFDLSTDTAISEDPLKFGLHVEKEGFCKSGHGYHSLEYSRRTGLSDNQRRTIYEIFGTLASKRRLRQRCENLAPVDGERTVLHFDESALLYEDGGTVVDILSLRLRWSVPKADLHMLRRIFEEPDRRLTLRRIQELGGDVLDEGWSGGAGNVRTWVAKMCGLGLVETVEQASIDFTSFH